MISILEIFSKASLDINAPYDPNTKYEPHIMPIICVEPIYEPYKYDLLKWFAKNGQEPDIIINEKGETLREFIEKQGGMESTRLIEIFQPYWE